MVLGSGALANQVKLGLMLTFVVAAGMSIPVRAQMKMDMPMPVQGKVKGPKIPAMIADMSKAKSLPTPIEPGMKGYGTRAVPGDTLAEMKARCATRATDRVATARCDQLRRTLKSQPGNTR